MAELNQQAGPAAGRGGGAAGRGRGRGGNPSAGGAPSQVLLNPERAPALISKWQKLLGKDLESIKVEYTAEGVSVELIGMPGTAYEKKVKDEVFAISIPEYRNLKAKELAPSNEEAKFAFRNKFEVRLNQEFPKSIDLGDGSETAIREATQSLPFEQRRMMLLSNKQFKSAYPNGFAGGANPPA